MNAKEWRLDVQYMYECPWCEGRVEHYAKRGGNSSRQPGTPLITLLRDFLSTLLFKTVYIFHSGVFLLVLSPHLSQNVQCRHNFLRKGKTAQLGPTE